MFDLQHVLDKLERSAHVRIVADVYGHETVEVKGRLWPFWRQMKLSRKDAGTVCRIIRRNAHVCSETGIVWLQPSGFTEHDRQGPADGRKQ